MALGQQLATVANETGVAAWEKPIRAVAEAIPGIVDPAANGIATFCGFAPPNRERWWWCAPSLDFSSVRNWSIWNSAWKPRESKQ